MSSGADGMVVSSEEDGWTVRYAGEGEHGPRYQIGGDHYAKRKTQPWDLVDEYGLDFYEGNALKYLLRWKDKGGVEDLKKCRHYLDRLIEKNSA